MKTHIILRRQINLSIEKMFRYLIFISILYSSIPLRASSYVGIKDSLLEKKATTKTDSIDDKIFEKPDVQPEFPGGISSLYKFLGENIKYPEKAHKANVSGKVFAKFVVEKDGSISNIQILRGIGFGVDEEVIRVIKLMPIWSPGQKNGKACRSFFNMPISCMKIEE
ncbi:MAG: energy transducer TonB [Leadbetterella sp.]